MPLCSFAPMQIAKMDPIYIFKFTPWHSLGKVSVNVCFVAKIVLKSNSKSQIFSVTLAYNLLWQVKH